MEFQLSPWVRNMAQRIALSQTTALRFLGFLGHTNGSGKFHVFRNICSSSIALCIILLSSAWFIINFGWYLTSLVQLQSTSPHAQSLNLLVRIFVGLPYCTIYLRPLITLIITLRKRSQFGRLLQSFEHLSSNHGPKNGPEILSWIFCFIPAIIPIGSFLWHADILLKSGRQTDDTMTLWSDFTIYMPWTINLPLWLFSFLCTTISTASCFASQQIIFFLVIYASHFKDIIEAMNEDIRTTAVDCRKSPLKQETLLHLEKRFNHWRETIFEVQQCCDEANDFYSYILFVLYGLDFMTVLGFGVNLIVNVVPSASSYAYYAAMALIYCLNITIFLWPLVAFHEEVFHVHSVIKQKFQKNTPLLSVI